MCVSRVDLELHVFMYDSILTFEYKDCILYICTLAYAFKLHFINVMLCFVRQFLRFQMQK
ncbi:hypothetical protein HanIR_Chr05g0233501 [Helianthus annuus]|nr:hypothetical protein HanIR_Chr05g0233501 [Helianthus annuus]